MQSVDVIVDDAALRLDELLQRTKQLEHLDSGTEELVPEWRTVEAGKALVEYT